MSPLAVVPWCVWSSLGVAPGLSTPGSSAAAADWWPALPGSAPFDEAHPISAGVTSLHGLRRRAHENAAVADDPNSSATGVHCRGRDRCAGGRVHQAPPAPPCCAKIGNPRKSSTGRSALQRPFLAALGRSKFSRSCHGPPKQRDIEYKRDQYQTCDSSGYRCMCRLVLGVASNAGWENRCEVLSAARYHRGPWGGNAIIQTRMASSPPTWLPDILLQTKSCTRCRLTAIRASVLSGKQHEVVGPPA
jgi:hypothetical protein